MAERMIGAQFFQRDPLACARELIGAKLVWGKCAGIIVETEAYFSENDEASHTFSRPSARAFIQRNKAGAAYIYFSYGAHWMLNVLVKGKQDGFVLIRALEPKAGIELMKRRRHVDNEQRLCSGPGKLTQALDITKRHHEINLCADPRYCFVRDSSGTVHVVADPRIGISRSVHHMWRFTLRGSRFVSRAVKL
jgi:DNA-3-methyladenine glycosylase